MLPGFAGSTGRSCAEVDDVVLVALERGLEIGLAVHDDQFAREVEQGRGVERHLGRFARDVDVRGGGRADRA